MLSLLKKDFDVLVKQYKMYVILLAFFLISGSIGTTDEFFSTFPLVICSWFTASLIGYDERCIAEGTAEAIDKKLYVQEKYLFLLCLVGFSFVVCVSGLTSRYSVGGAEFCNILLTMLAAALLVPAVMLPIIFKNSAQKSVLKYLAVLIVAVAVCYYFSAAFEHRYIAQIGLVFCIGAGVLFLIALFVSYKLSVKFYLKRED